MRNKNYVQWPFLEYHDNIEEARQNAEARRQKVEATAAKKRTNNFTPKQKFKCIQKASPVYTPSPSPDVVASNPTPW